MLFSRPFLSSRLFTARRFARRFSALCFLTGALVQVAQAQDTVTPASGSPFLYSFTSFVTVGALVCLIIGIKKPETFRFLFKEKTSKAVVGWSFGALMVLAACIGSSFEPKPAVTAQEVAAKSAQTKAESDARAADARAKAAEDRAAKAEKVAASKSAGKPKRLIAKHESKESEGSSDSSGESPTAAPATEEVSENVTVQNIPGLGKREVGQVDNVQYAIVSVETAQSVGNEMSKQSADGVFYVLHVVASNHDKKTHDVTTMMMKLTDDQDREFDPSSPGSMALSMAGDQSAEPFSAQVQPGVLKKFTLIYDAPADASGLKLKIPAALFSMSGSASIKLPKSDE